MDIAKGKYWDIAWNPVVGCSPVSEGCNNCWALKMARRQTVRKYLLTHSPQGWTGTIGFDEDDLTKPFGWKKSRIIATCWMGDLFHKNTLYRQIYKIFDQMFYCKQHTYLMLTKRPAKMYRITKGINSGMINTSVWLGVSVENQAAADERVPDLLKCEGWNKWISVEPMLGPIDIEPYLATGKIGQVVCGGETGPGTAPVDSDWVLSLLSQCSQAGVPFFFKQWGGKVKGRTLFNQTFDYLTWRAQA